MSISIDHNSKINEQTKRNLYLYIYIFIYLFIAIFVYMYIYIHTNYGIV